MNKGNNKTGKKGDFAPSVGFWPAKSGNGYTCFIDEKTIETLANAKEGGRLFLQPVESDNEKAPKFRLTFFDDAPKQQEESI
jgi:hypothetical protein